MKYKGSLLPSIKALPRSQAQNCMPALVDVPGLRQKSRSASVGSPLFHRFIYCIALTGLSLLHQASAVSAAEDVCGNGVLVVGEECDDGNLWNGDGCSSTCHYEDTCGCASGEQFICERKTDPVTGALITVCCPTLVHPVSGAKVCDCAPVTPLGQGDTTWMDIDCSVRDVDECTLGISDCAPNARCVNVDGTVNSEGYTCECDFFGDGWERCETVRYAVSVVLGVHNTSAISALSDAARELMDAALVQSVLDALIGPDSYLGVAVDLLATGDSSSADARRRLLAVTESGSGGNTILPVTPAATGELYTLLIEVASWDSMQSLVANLNSALLAEQVQSNSGNPALEVTVLQEATAIVDDSASEFSAAMLVAPGFLVQDFSYRLVGGEYIWDIKLDVFAPPGMVHALFLTKQSGGTALAEHECTVSPDVCCLWRMKESFYMGDFGNEVETYVQPWCDPDTGALPEYAAEIHSEDILFPLLELGQVGPWIQNVAEAGDVPPTAKSSAEAPVPTLLHLHLHQADIASKFADVSVTAEATDFRFAVGILFWKPLPVPAMYAAVGQTQFSIHTVNSADFAVFTSQSYSFLEFLQMTLYEMHYAPFVSEQHRLQFVRAIVVVPAPFSQAEILLTSIQSAAAYNMSVELLGAERNTLPLLQWRNPCFSATDPTARDGSALWDSPNSTARQLYETASVQACAMRGIEFCNTVTRTGEDANAGNTLLTIDIPLGGEIIPLAAAPEEGVHSGVLVRFVVKALDGNGKEAVSQVSAHVQASLSTAMLMCAAPVSSVLKDTDFVSVSLSVGTALQPTGLSERGAVVFHNLQQAVSPTDVSQEYTAISALDSVLTVSVEGMFNFFNAPGHQEFSVGIDSAVLVHVRNEDKYATLTALVQNASAYTITEVSVPGGSPATLSSVSLTFQFQQACYGDGGSDCAVTYPITARNATAGAHMLEQNINADIAWLLSEFGDTPAMRNIAEKFALDARTQFGFNWRYRKGWWITPTYAWPAQQTIGVSDRTLLFIAVSVLRK